MTNSSNSDASNSSRGPDDPIVIFESGQAKSVPGLPALPGLEASSGQPQIGTSEHSVDKGTYVVNTAVLAVVVCLLTLGSVVVFRAARNRQIKTTQATVTAEANPLVPRPSPPPAVGATTAPLGWADSALTPTWVARGGIPTEPAPESTPPGDVNAAQAAAAASARAGGDNFGHSYQPIGTAQVPGGIAPGSPGSDASAATAGLATLLPRLVVHFRDGSYSLTDPGIGGQVGANPSSSYLWSVPGNCGARFALQQSGSTGPAYAKGSDLDGAGSLVVPDNVCNAATSRMVSQRGLAISSAANLARSMAQSDLSQSVGAPPFDPSELATVVTQKTTDGLIAWGVFRRPNRSTQIAPVPPSPQLAFVARTTDGVRWSPLWVKYTTDGRELLDLAGVYALDAGAAPTAFYLLRSSGDSKLIAVAPDGNGYKAAGVVSVR